tara:strand:- start:676 stop:849 length:174 start_codon:yes stop_codon:yes gene_type:complete
MVIMAAAEAAPLGNMHMVEKQVLTIPRLSSAMSAVEVEELAMNGRVNTEQDLLMHEA